MTAYTMLKMLGILACNLAVVVMVVALVNVVFAGVFA